MTSHPTLPSPGKHLPVLDGIRGLAIALVLFHHFFAHATAGRAIADRVVFSVASRGWMGVDLFFVLSGFLITGILWDAKGSAGYFRRFYARRVLRIFPAYYAVLIVFFLVLPALGSTAAFVPDPADQGLHWAFLTNFKIAAEGQWYPQHIPNVFWSLAIEEQFYMVWPIVVLLCGRRMLMGVCGLLFFTSMATRLVLATNPDVSWVTSFVLTPARMDGLAFGSFLALLARSSVNVRLSRVVAVAVGLAVLVPLAYLATQRPEGWRDTPMQSLRFSLIALLFGALVWLCVTHTSQTKSLAARVFCNRGMRWLGKYSYALYLWHGPVGEATTLLYDPSHYGEVMGSRLPHALLFCCLAGGASMLVAWLSWHLLEKHCLKLKRLFPAPPSRTLGRAEREQGAEVAIWSGSARRLAGSRTSDRGVG